MSLSQCQVDAIWKCMDKNGDGVVTPEEFYVGFNQYLKSLGNPTKTRKDCEMMFQGIDHTPDKKVTKDELEEELLNRESRRVGLKKQFKAFAAKDGKPNISKDELRGIITDTGKIKPEHIEYFVKTIFELADKDKSGEIDLEEFEKVMDLL